MNSQSNRNCNNNENCSNPCPPRFAACQSDEDLHPLPCPALLECGEGFNPRLTASIPPDATSTPIPVPLAEVEIDTTCLCSPNIKIEFSTLIQFDVTGATGPLVIQLSRSCCNNRCHNNGNNGKKILRTYTITLPVPGGATTTLPFSFIFCKEDVKSQDCTYFVDIVAANITGGTFIAFENTDISALAVGCEKKC